ncbi:MAG TPA: hypothetical protein VKB50_26285 [Vicinamibacterales bacterium]|nr:hypothetical protein [Vicinamibacterales bacterium]
MPTIYGAVDLVKNELRNAVMQNLGSAPASPVKGLMYFNSTDNTFYWYDGTQWVAAKSGAGLTPASTVTTQAIGDAPVVGVGTAYARDDHKHGMPAFGTVTAETTFGASSGNGASVNIARSDHTHGNPTHDAAAHSTIPLSALALPTANVNLGGFRITNVASPLSNSDAVPRMYVDNAINGLSWKDTCRLASTANVALTGLTAIDGVTPIANDRILLKNQTTGSQNGIWVAASGAWARATDAATSTDILQAAVFISEGTTQADTAWVMTTNAPITIDTTALTWVQFGAPASYIGGAGLTLTGTTFDVGAGTGITVAADSVAVDTTVIATQAYVNTAVTGVTKKFAAALTGTASPETVTHNLNTRDVHVQVLNGATPYTAVEVDWDATTVNAVTIRYNPNLGAGYRAVVVG